VEASARPRFSVVIPAYNEERLLPMLLDSINAAREIYGRGPGAIEVIVADNASTDSTASLAASRDCLVTGTTWQCCRVRRFSICSVGGPFWSSLIVTGVGRAADDPAQ
jgi:hypothetical protein